MGLQREQSGAVHMCDKKSWMGHDLQHMHNTSLRVARSTPCAIHLISAVALTVLVDLHRTTADLLPQQAHPEDCLGEEWGVPKGGGPGVGAPWTGRPQGSIGFGQVGGAADMS